MSKKEVAIKLHLYYEFKENEMSDEEAVESVLDAIHGIVEDQLGFAANIHEVYVQEVD